MRKLMIAVATVVGMAMAGSGCTDNRDRAANERRELARTEAQADQDIANARQDAARQKADIDRKTEEKVANRQQEVLNKRQDVARADRDLAVNRDRELAVSRDRDLAVTREGDDVALHDRGLRTGSSLDRDRAAVTDGTVKGVLTSTFGSKIEIRDLRGNKEKLKTDELTRVFENGREVRIGDFRDGTEVRASFVLDKDHDKVARDVQVLHPVMK
jgi:hypothetical protein